MKFGQRIKKLKKSKFIKGQIHMQNLHDKKINA